MQRKVLEIRKFSFENCFEMLLLKALEQTFYAVLFWGNRNFLQKMFITSTTEPGLKFLHLGK